MNDLNEPIIKSILDDDLYKFNMGCVAFHLFPRAIAEYDFFMRGDTKFPENFAIELQKQIVFLSQLQLTSNEFDFLKTISYARPTYIEWFQGYKMKPNEVQVSVVNGNLKVKIKGPWYRTIYWEVKLMAIISELYFFMTGVIPDINWKQKIYDKGTKLALNNCHWIDFGTRRRFSYDVQDELVKGMSKYKGFLGTSNMHFAMKYGITPHGTYAHESIMAMSAVYGCRMANKMWMKHWSEHYNGNVGVSLTDTFTTDVFLNDFGSYEARLFDGVRQDSGVPMEWGHKMLRHYELLGIPTSNKRFVFSDALTTDSYIALDKEFRKYAQPIGGIGTHFTNDVGAKALNMVIKMTSFDGTDVVKLSDTPGKHTGNLEEIITVKRSLKIKQ